MRIPGYQCACMHVLLLGNHTLDDVCYLELLLLFVTGSAWLWWQVACSPNTIARIG